ncbi:APHP domain-containing protein [Methanocaldococcus bathoardescens]|uniref:APHP domain-containing protein n=1 Tax=Methanocaldococcus bathoardescens TaxID=1301915 RepID=A0A076LEK9_9EURY|nr:CARDB domain-containing protein [Methanocaldococcus bathoardescens]AIJ05242.1 APHP domain-containing protein [Methanocaldococcus bathoardescens]
MKWKTAILSILMISLIGVYGENVTVELVPSDLIVNLGQSFDLTLEVKNVPNETISDGYETYSGYCGGFETYIYFNSNALNLTNINFSDIATGASIAYSVSNGRIWISMYWSNSYPYGNFTIATLRFKTLNQSDNTTITLSGTKVSNSDGTYKWEVSNNNLIVKNSNVKIIAEPIADLLTPKIINAELGDNVTISVVVAPKENKTVKVIEGTLSFDKNVLTPINVSSSVGNVFFNSSSNFFKIDDLNQSTNFTINITYNVINVGNTTVKLDNVYMEDINGSYVKDISSNATTIVIPGPDLVAEIVPVSLKAYTNNTILILVKNVGERNATGNFSVKLLVDTNEIGTSTINGLNLGETKEINFTFMPTEERNYTFCVLVDYNNDIKEIDENNNKYVDELYATEKPISVNIIPSTNLTKTEETFEVNITLNNITSDRPAKAIEGVLTYNANVLECVNFTFLINASEENGTLLKDVTYENGKVTFKLMDGIINNSVVIATAKFKALDVGNSDIELSDLVVSDINGYKFNKVSTNKVNVVVQGPNIKITNISVPNPSIYRIPTTINITITNNGHQDAKSFDVVLYADADEIGKVTVDGLNISQSKTITFNWIPDDIKTFTIVAVVDPSNAVKEENESDNKLVKKIDVIEIPVWVNVYNTTPIVNGTFNATIEVSGINERLCSGYDGKLIFKNLEIENIELIGINNYTINNSELIFSGYNFTKSGSFKIANITFRIIDENKSYSAILKCVVLSDKDGYKFEKVFINNTILDESLQKVFECMCIEADVLDKVDIDNVKLESAGDINITILPIKIGDAVDEITIPKVSRNISINITDDVLLTINLISNEAETLKEITKVVDDEKELNETLDKIIEDIKPVLCVGFNITNKTKEEPKKLGNKLISTIKFKAENISNKGFAIIRIPVGELKVENIVVNNGTDNITLKENDVNSKVGWYKYVGNGIIEITLIKDPLVMVTLAKELPATTSSTTTTTYYSGGGSSHHTIMSETYSDVAQDIKSEKIKEIVHKAKIIIGSEIDNNLSAKCLKNTTELINQPLTITEDCILVGGPVANPLVKKYMWTFPVKITNDYPGKNRGVIQKQIINGHLVILLAGSDRWGTKAAVEYFKQLDDIPDEPIFVEWRDGKAVKIEKP